MSKLKNGLYKRVVENEMEEKRQRELRIKYNVEDNIKIIEKSNMAKFTIKTIEKIIRMLANIVIYVLAATGGIALIYPSCRNEIIVILQNVIQQLHMFVR